MLFEEDSGEPKKWMNRLFSFISERQDLNPNVAEPNRQTAVRRPDAFGTRLAGLLKLYR